MVKIVKCDLTDWRFKSFYSPLKHKGWVNWLNRWIVNSVFYKLQVQILLLYYYTSLMILMIGFFIFHFFAGLAFVCSFMVISSKNPIYSILFLILTFFNFSSLLILLSNDFLPILFLIVYVGAIAVLFLFVLIMLNIKISELREGTKYYLTISLVFGCIFLFEFLVVMKSSFVSFISPVEFIDFAQMTSLSFGLCFDFLVWCFKSSNILNLGEVLFTSFSYPFISLGFILLLAMIGTIVLTLEKKYLVQSQLVYKQVLRDSNAVTVRYTAL